MAGRLPSRLHGGGAEVTYFIIRNLPLHLADAARNWLERLAADQIHSWTDLKRIFVGNFQRTYGHPGNSWDLRSCRQEDNESLRDYIRRFSRLYNTLPNITGSDAVNAFTTGTSCRTLVHKLGRKGPQTIKELLDIATKHATGEEAVGAVYGCAKGKAKWDEAAGEGGSRPSDKKKKNNKGQAATFVAAAE